MRNSASRRGWEEKKNRIEGAPSTDGQDHRRKGVEGIPSGWGDTSLKEGKPDLIEKGEKGNRQAETANLQADASKDPLKKGRRLFVRTLS